MNGESLSRIDWRRSARDDHTYVRDREWEAAHTIWLWADLSPSMMYKSRLGAVSKESRALVLIGDFLDPAEKIMDRLGPLARRGLRGHVVEIADPAEEVFPYSGRTEFTDPETGEKLTAGRAEVLREDYQRAYVGRRDSLGVTLRHLGWTFTPHRTDRPASEALVAVHTYLSGMPGRATHGGQL